MAKRELSPLFTNESLSPQEREFAVRVHANTRVTTAYREVFPERCKTAEGKELDSRSIAVKAKALLRNDRIQDYLTFIQLPQAEIARRIVSRRMIVGADSVQFDTAKSVLAREKDQDVRLEVFELWRQVMMECGAEVCVAVKPGEREARISLGDLVSGKAWLELPGWGRIKLLELAGFPWNDDDPEAKASPLQHEVAGRDERLMILQGGTGLGKSTMGGAFAFLGICIPNQRWAIVADTFDHCHDEFQYAYRAWIHLFGPRSAKRISVVHTAKHHDMEIETPWSSSLRTISLDYRQGSAALGKQFDGIVMGEGSLVDEVLYYRRVKRASDRAMKERSGTAGYVRRTGRIFIMTTGNWTQGAAAAEWDAAEKRCDRKWERLHVGNCPSWAETVYVREAESIENPAFSRDAFEAARKTLPAEIFAEQYQGKRARRSGLIYKEFDPDRHRIAMPPATLIREMRLGVGQDTGKHYAGYLVGLDRERRFYVLGEAYAAEQKIGDNMGDLKEVIDEVLGGPWQLQERDPAKRYELLKDRIDLWRVDNATQHLEDLMDGLDAPIERDPTAAGGVGGGVLSGIDFIRELMKNDRFFIVDSCEWLLWEIGRYIWAVISNRGGTSLRTLQPRKQDDHGLDAVRIICKALCDLGPIEVLPPPMTFEDAYEKQIRYQVIGRAQEPFRRAERQREGGRLLG
jgi:hypothetical protein